jgi:crossover junction endodeoxyribonuclease RuvC
MVAALLGLTQTPRADAADALALAITHLRVANNVVAAAGAASRKRGGRAALRELVATRRRQSG